ncbi:MAG: Mur ligase family protein [Bacteriovoracaceae bacterium]|nr:Mur ligase family protein [Bacteriovoracaceae bacterium]
MYCPNNWLEQNYPPERFTPGFSRLEKAFDILEIKELHNKVITIGGTNGKGTVARSIYQQILYNHKRVALFTSPHLECVSQRFSFNGEDIDKIELLDLFRFIESKIFHIKLSFYEFLYVCFLYKARNYEFIIQEVGLGGRLDATNFFKSDINIVTSIGRDHIELLGNSFKSILLEKIAMAKKSKFLLTSFYLDYLIQYSKSFSCTHNISYTNFKDKNYLETNLCLIKAVADYYNLSFNKSIDNHFSENKTFTYSLCHNLSAVRNLVGLWVSKLPKILIISYSHRDIKELEYMSKLFLSLKQNELIDELYLTHIDQFKAADKDVLIKISKKLEIEFLNSKELDELLSKKKNIHLSGSNYFVGKFITKYSTIC